MTLSPLAVKKIDSTNPNKPSVILRAITFGEVGKTELEKTPNEQSEIDMTTLSAVRLSNDTTAALKSLVRMLDPHLANKIKIEKSNLHYIGEKKFHFVSGTVVLEDNGKVTKVTLFSRGDSRELVLLRGAVNLLNKSRFPSHSNTLGSRKVRHSPKVSDVGDGLVRYEQGSYALPSV